ncbi:MAG: DUF6538 domain-containing protein [Pseudomonadota bacterium]
MAHKPPHTIIRNGSFVFNRRVPERVVQDFGSSAVRISLGSDEQEAFELAKALSEKLDHIWGSPKVRPVAVAHLLAALKPKVTTIDDALGLYLQDRGAGKGDQFAAMARIACETLTRVAGCRDILSYQRQDARAFIQDLATGGAKTGTIRRRLNTIKAVFEHAYLEGDIERRNPFAKLRIPGEGEDRKKRGTFSNQGLLRAYQTALVSGSEIKLSSLSWEKPCLCPLELRHLGLVPRRDCLEAAKS